MEKIYSFAKKLFFVYETAMFYLGAAVGELRKPLVLSNEAGMILLLLATYLNFRPPLEVVVIVFIVINSIGIIAGRALKETGVIAYNAKLGNKQSPELMSILESVTNIEKKVDELSKKLK